MARTEKYCEECSRKLTPDDKSPQDREFFNASSFPAGSHPDGKRRRSEYGVCVKCGGKGIVNFYEDSN